MDTYAYDAGLPCKNPHCKSHGQPHPNCKCYSGGGENYAHGGSVCSSGQPHLSTCEYFADGGEIERQEHALMTKGHASVHHGLLGLLTNVGHSNLADPEKHTKTLDEARMHLSRLQDPVDSLHEPKKTLGVRLANHVAAGDHDSAAELMHGHPLMGSVGKTNSKDILQKLSGPMMSQEPDAPAFRSSVDYLHSAVNGQDRLKSAAKQLIGMKSGDDIKPDKGAREALKTHLNEINLDPKKLMDVGGSLGHYMPDQATQLAASAVIATNYLMSIKPKPLQGASLDRPMSPSKGDQFAYDRQIDIAQQPLLVLQHVKNGTLMPQDIKTLQTLYPGLYKSMVDEVGEALIEAETEKKTIPYKQKQTMSLLLGQPLDSTMTPQAILAIMKAQGPQQMQAQSKKPVGGNKATAVELKQINKVDEMAETPLQSRQIDKTKD